GSKAGLRTCASGIARVARFRHGAHPGGRGPGAAISTRAGCRPPGSRRRPMSVGPRERRMQLDEPIAGVEIAWLDWGPEAADRTIVCVHGLTRNARDFDALAASLAAGRAQVL